MLDRTQKEFVRRQVASIRGLELEAVTMKARLHNDLPKVHELDDADLEWLLANLGPEIVWFRMKVRMEITRRSS